MLFSKIKELKKRWDIAYKSAMREHELRTKYGIYEKAEVRIVGDGIMTVDTKELFYSQVFQRQLEATKRIEQMQEREKLSLLRGKSFES